MTQCVSQAAAVILPSSVGWKGFKKLAETKDASYKEKYDLLYKPYEECVGCSFKG